MSNIIEVKKLSYSYPNQKNVLKEISFNVSEKNIFGFLGANGSGKSTLFKILSTSFKIQSGEIIFFGKNFSDNLNYIRKQIGVVFQSPSLDNKLTVEENLFYSGYFFGLSGKKLKEKVDDLLLKFDLVEKRKKIVETLSGGMKRRVEIAKSILHNPKFLILDEPSSGLDPIARRNLWNLFLKLNEEGITILLTTHFLDEAEKCNTIAIMDEGKIIALDSPLNLKQSIGNDILYITSNEVENLQNKIENQFGKISSIIDSKIRIEIENPHNLIPKLYSEFRNEILSLTISHSNLEDVFIRKTGKKFETN